MKKRIDVLLCERGLASSREKAQRMIMAGLVLVGDQPVTKAGQLLEHDCAIRIRGEVHPYVSRGGLKLEAALREFKISAQGKTALDVGASTGGFTHVLLLDGATKVFAVDVGHNQLDWKIRNDPRVVVMEKVNARNLEFSQIGQKFDLIVMDLSFISITKVLPALMPFARGSETDWITLIKPQFEVGKERVGKGGIVQSEEYRQEAITDVTCAAEGLGLKRISLIESPITGTDGNREYLAHWKIQ